MNRREALSVVAKIALSAGIATVVAGIGGYFVGSSLAPTREVIRTVEVAKKPTGIRLNAYEFGFNGSSGGPTLVVKAGEEVTIILTNKGWSGT